MDLTIKDVAELLNVSETTVRRWINAGVIPAYRLNHRFRFSRTEIESWLLSCKMNKTPVLTEKVNINTEKAKNIIGRQIGMQAYSLYRAINKGNVLINVEGDSKEDIIKQSVKIIAEDLNSDKDVMTELLMDREALMPTALNHGIGIPHTRDIIFLENAFDVIYVVYPKIPIDYGALDGKPVHTMFFLFACEDKRHLHLLAKLAHLTKDQDHIDFFKTRPSKQKLMQFVKKWEAKLNIPVYHPAGK